MSSANGYVDFVSAIFNFNLSSAINQFLQCHYLRKLKSHFVLRSGRRRGGEEGCGARCCVLARVHAQQSTDLTTIGRQRT